MGCPHICSAIQRIRSRIAYGPALHCYLLLPCAGRLMQPQAWDCSWEALAEASRACEIVPLRLTSLGSSSNMHQSSMQMQYQNPGGSLQDL